MQNMIIESERDANMEFNVPLDYQGPLTVPHQGVSVEIVNFLATYVQIRDEATKDQVRDVPMLHLWALRTHEQLDLYV